MQSILVDRDVNAQNPVETLVKGKPKSMEYHRKVFESRLKSGQIQQTYISPSDNIQSPATKKLQAFKNKHILKKAKPQTLFARTSSKNFDIPNDGSIFDDVPATEPASSETAET